MLFQSVFGLLFSQDFIFKMIKFEDLIINFLPYRREQVLNACNVLMLLFRLHELIERFVLRTSTLLYVFHELNKLDEYIDD